MNIQNLPTLGLYRHFKGAYYFLSNILRGSTQDCKGYVCEYFNVLHPEYGHFSRPVEQWDTDVSDRIGKDNVTGQVHRFEKVVSIDTDIKNFTTENLLTELSRRPDSPLQSLDIEGLSECVVATDFIVGEYEKATEDEPAGVFVEAAFSTKDQAHRYWLNHARNQRAKVYKRTFLPVDD